MGRCNGFMTTPIQPSSPSPSTSSAKGLIVGIAVAALVIIRCVAALAAHLLGANGNDVLVSTSKSSQSGDGATDDGSDMGGESESEGDQGTHDLRPAPSLQHLRNATLSLPTTCAGFGLQDQNASGNFVDGTAMSPNEHNARVVLRSATPGVFEGKNVAVAVLICSGRGAYSNDSIAMYDADLKMVASLET